MGATTHKGTTTVKVEEREDITLSSYIDLIYGSKRMAGWRRDGTTADMVTYLASVAEEYPVGTILEKRKDVIQCRTSTD